MSNVTATCTGCDYVMACTGNDLIGYATLFASAGAAFVVQKIAHKFFENNANANTSFYIRAITFTAVLLTAVCLLPSLVEVNLFSESDLQKIVDLNNMFLYTGALMGYMGSKTLVVVSGFGAALGANL